MMLLFFRVNDITDGGGVGRHSETSALVDFTDSKKLWFATELSLSQQMQAVSFQIKYYVAQGELKLALYDVTEGTCDEQGFLLAASCDMLETRTYTGGGTDAWDLSGLPADRTYAVSPYCSPECMFDMRVRTVCRVALWQWLYRRVGGSHA